MGPPTVAAVGNFLLPLPGWGCCCPPPNPRLCSEAPLTCTAPTKAPKPRIQLGDFSPSSFSLSSFLFIFQIAALQPSNACWPELTSAVGSILGLPCLQIRFSSPEDHLTKESGIGSNLWMVSCSPKGMRRIEEMQRKALQ